MQAERLSDFSKKFSTVCFMPRDGDRSSQTVRLGGGATLSYDRLVVTVGSTIRAGAIERYDEAAMQVMPHGWKACGQTLTLRR